ncbi:MAG: hypothetical protein CSA11_10125 [Chloroflexi bacterium]|nr:MAG: hypothetical protein CSA11_10125 [Chloroflexota bacterium]
MKTYGQKCAPNWESPPPDATTVPHVSYHVAESYDEAKVIDVLREAATQERPFTINATGIGIFPAPNPIIYVPVVRSLYLTQLHAKLFPRLSATALNNNAYYAPKAWIPHITLGHSDISIEQLGTLTQWLHQQAINWTITIDNFYLLTDDTQRLVQEFRVTFGNH